MINAIYRPRARGQRACRLRCGPLARFLDGFAAMLIERGHTRDTCKRYLWHVGRFNAWLGSHGLHVRHVGLSTAARFVRTQRRYRRGEAQGSVLLLEEFLRRSGALPRRVQHPVKTGSLIEREYLAFLAEERGFAAVTIDTHRTVVRRFLAGRTAGWARRLRAQDVSAHVIAEARRRGATRASAVAHVLRWFLLYLRQRGATRIDLARAVPRVSRGSRAKPPRYLGASAVEALLRSVDRTTPAGVRNYAIMLLLARLGLRSCEVVALTLDDIDWRAAEFAVRGKGKAGRLPLLPEIGAALVAYLQVRPKSQSRHVFLRLQAPIGRTLDSGAVSMMVRRAMMRIGVKPTFGAAHVLRHSLATKMLAHGVPLEGIAEVLRHATVNPTAGYARVDFRRLRLASRPWPGARR